MCFDIGNFMDFYKLPSAIQSKIKICPDRGCWLWQGQLTPNGYGSIKHYGLRFLAHVFTCGFFNKSCPDNKVHDHLCEIRNCCNPAHIQITTQSINCKRINNRRIYIDDDGKLIRNGHKYKSKKSKSL